MGCQLLSVRSSALVWTYSTHQGSELVILLAIADSTNDDGIAFMAMPSLAKKGRMTVRNAQHIVRRLEQSGELEIDKGAGPGGCNLFRVKLRWGVKGASPPDEAQGGEGGFRGGVKGASPGGVQPASPPPPHTIDDPSSDPSLRGRKPPRGKKAGVEKEKKNPLAADARELTKHLYDEHERIFEPPLGASFGKALGEAKRLLSKYSRGAGYNLRVLKKLVTEWMDDWNEDHSPAYERDDFSMTAFVEKYVVIHSWSDRRAEKKKRKA